MSLTDVLILSLATWRAAYFFTKENAPFQLMARFRSRWTLGGMLKCIYCTSIWCAIGGYLLMQTPFIWIVYIAAASGGAMMLWRYTGGDYGEDIKQDVES